MRSKRPTTRIWLSGTLVAAALGSGIALAPPTAAGASAPVIVVASTSDAGEKSNGWSSHPTISPDGTTVAFGSEATNLDPADLDEFTDVYVNDFTTGDLRLASTSDTGVKGDGTSEPHALSADGTRVLFESTAKNLDPGDRDGRSDVYVKDLKTGDLMLASTSETGVKSNGYSWAGDISADGTRVLFTSNATNLVARDGDGQPDVYLKDLTNGQLTLVSTSERGVKGDKHSWGAELSADGSRVALISSATNLHPADHDDIRDVYVKHVVTGSLTLASSSDTGVKGNDDAISASLSADGRRVAFDSLATNLDPGDPDEVRDVFLKVLATGNLALVSTSAAGVKGDADSFAPSFSGNGADVAFTSDANNLHPAEGDPYYDVFVKHLATGGVTLVTVSETGEPASGDSNVGVLSHNGTVAAVSYADNLHPDDTDRLPDIFVWDVPPVALPNAYGVIEDLPYAIAAPGVLGNDHDPAGDELTAILERRPAHGDLVLRADGSFTYTPDPDFTGADSFTYRARSGPTSSLPATVTITVHPGPPLMSIGDVSSLEGTGAPTQFRFAVTLDEATSVAVTVKYQTIAGSAVSPQDYATVSGTLTFAPGQTMQTVVVHVVGDVKIESDEEFKVWLNKAAGAVILDDLATGVIRNDDG